MGKIICEVCGTVYPDSADCCPICGYSRDHGGFDRENDFYSMDPDTGYSYDSGEDLDDFDLSEYASLAGMDYPPAEDPVQPSYRQPQQRQPVYDAQGRKPIFDYDAVNPNERRRSSYDSYEDVGNEVTLNDYPQDYYDNYDNYNGGEEKSHVGLIIFLIILILALIGASGFLLFKFILPNLNTVTPIPETIVTEAPTTVPTTDPSIPCEKLNLLEEGQVKLTREGQFYLIHAQVQPEDTTDTLTYSSEDESIVLVDKGGKITAVGEGSTNVILICGNQILKLPVVVSYGEETEPAETLEAPTAVAPGTDPEETVDTVEGEEDELLETESGEAAAPAEGSETQAPEQTPEETTEETDDGLKDVELKLKKTDLQSGVQGVSFRLELDCELTPEEVEWSSSNGAVATVKNGVITTIGPGLCNIVAKYGDQEVTCIIRCVF